MDRLRLSWSVFDWGGSGFVDRLNSCYTVVILLIAAIAVTLAPYFRYPITCNAPAHATGANIAYAHQTCWEGGVYHLPFADYIPINIEERTVVMTRHFHYIGLLFIGQALLFYIIHPLWQTLQTFSGTSLIDVTEASISSQSDNPIVSDRSLRYLIKKCLIASHGCNCGLILSYLFVRLLYCLNSLLHILFINAFVGGSAGFSYGPSLIRSSLILNADHLMPFNPYFPINVLCDFKTISVGKTHRETWQCTLTLTRFYQNVYAFVWVWMEFVCVMNFLYSLYWFFAMLIPPIKNIYIKNRLIMSGKIKVEEANVDSQFSSRMLGGDAYVIARHIGMTGSDVTAAAVIGGLWDEYKDGSGGQAPTPSGPAYVAGGSGIPMTEYNPARPTGSQPSGQHLYPTIEKPF